MACLRQNLVGENPKFVGENRKILLRCRGNYALILGENGGYWVNIFSYKKISL